MTVKPTVLVLSSGYHLYREYLLAGIAQHADVWLLLDHEPTWETPYLIGSTLVDTLDQKAVVTAAQAVAAERRIDGVLSWDELRMINCAAVAQALGLPGGEIDSMWQCRDKHLTRRQLDEHGIGQPRSIAVSDVEQALQAAERHGYPVVVKPRALGASIGVTRADTADQLVLAYEQARQAWEDGVPPNDSVLIEQLVTGQEISIDSAVHDGRVQPLFLARKLVDFQPYCEEVGHIVDANDPLLTDPQLRELLAGAHAAVGLRDAITHTEIMLTEDGPKIIEINCRLGGGLIPYVASVAMGVDPGRIAVDIAVGRAPQIAPTKHQTARIDFLYPPADLVTDAVVVDDRPLPAGVHRIAALAGPGQRLQLPPAGHVSARYGYVITVGPTPAHCAAALPEALTHIQLIARNGDSELAA